uniref:small monomeric GTPase n=1 Tax=Accipiter nisus TaxID=211598 RepID=A0A8B9M2P7_9AVES
GNAGDSPAPGGLRALRRGAALLTPLPGCAQAGAGSAAPAGTRGRPEPGGEAARAAVPRPRHCGAGLRLRRCRGRCAAWRGVGRAAPGGGGGGAVPVPVAVPVPLGPSRAQGRAAVASRLVLAAPSSPCLVVVCAGGGGGGEGARRQRGAAACVADGAGLGAAAAQGGGRRAGPRGGLGGRVAGALRGAVPSQEAAAAPGRLQAAGDHHRVAGGGQDQPHGALHRRHLLRGLQVHRGDTAGQERFNSITSAYYRSAKGIILVYDITKKETFDDLPKWMKMIDKYASEDAELLLVGNKLDCEVDREITRQQGEKFAQQITGMRFCEASAKDNFNVDEIFLKLVDDILKKVKYSGGGSSSDHINRQCLNNDCRYLLRRHRG